MTTLLRFFDHFSQMLTGDLEPATLERALGPSASGTQRLGHYAELVSRQHLLVMGDLFPVTQRALGARFRDLARRFVRTHPPHHWEVNEIGRDFAEHLESRDDLEPWLAELADLEFLYWSVMTAIRPLDPVDPGIDATLVVRQYTYDVLGLHERAFADPSAALVTPAATVHTLVFARTSHERRFVFRPSVEALVVIGRRAGDRSVAAVSLSESRLRAAEAQLVEWGVLAERERT